LFGVIGSAQGIYIIQLPTIADTAIIDEWGVIRDKDSDAELGRIVFPLSTLGTFVFGSSQIGTFSSFSSYNAIWGDPLSSASDSAYGWLFQTQVYDDGSGGFVTGYVFYPETSIIWLDPVYAIGYDYDVAPGAAGVLSVLIPTNIDPDDTYTLSWDSMSVELNTTDGGVGSTAYDFGGAQTSFSITGISETAELDPDDPLAFAAGFTFETGNPISYTQTARTNAPEPASVMLLSLGMAGMAFSRRRSGR